MPISESRLAEIATLADGDLGDGRDTSAFGDADWERYDAEVVAKTTEFCRMNSDAEELHEFAMRWNWDCGHWAIEEILNNPACEAATALLIYWLAAPEFYRQFADRDAVSKAMANVDMFDFITHLERRYVAGDFGVGRIAFDPRKPGERYVYSFVGTYDSLQDKFVRALPAFGGVLGQFSAPRTWGVRVAATFGAGN